ncbi:12811_t:CDS:1, partial [Cetraspora pellucida]
QSLIPPSKITNISIIVTCEKGCSMEPYYNTLNSNKSKLKSSSFDDHELYNSDKFIQTIMIYIRGLMFLNIVHPNLRCYVTSFKKKAIAPLEN